MEVSPIENLYNKKINFEVYKVEFEDDASEKHFSKARIHAFSSGRNRHKMMCDVETLKATSSTIYEKPVLFEVKKKMYGDKDFGGHVSEPKIAGFVVPNSAEFEELDDGRVGLVVLAKIWKHYAPDFMEIVSKKGESNRRVSVEVELLESEKDVSGWTKMLDFVYAGIAVLGKTITEASPGANLQMISFSSMDNKEDFFEKYAKYGNIDFSIPESVSDNAKYGLEIREKHGRGGTAISIAMGEFLSTKKSITPEKVLHMTEHFSSTKVSKDDKESDGWINFQLWGGTAGKRWSNKISKMMKDEDSREKTLFEEGEEMTKDSVENSESFADNLNTDGIVPEGKEDTVNMEDNKIENEDLETVPTEEVGESEDENLESFENKDGNEEPVTMQDEEDGDEGEEDSEDEESEEEEDAGDTEEFSLPVSEIRNRMEKAVYEASKNAGEMAYYIDHCDNYAYVFCDESGKYFRMPYQANGDEFAVTYTKDEEVYRGWPLVADFTAKEAEMEELRGFKANVEQERFEFAVEKALSNEAMDVLSKEQKEGFRSKAQDMRDSLGGWENELKAFAFDIASKNGGFKEVKPDKPETKVFGLPFKQTKVRSKNNPFG